MPTKAEIRLIFNEHFVNVNIRKVKDGEEFFHTDKDIKYICVTAEGVTLILFDKYMTGGPILDDFTGYDSIYPSKEDNFIKQLENSSFREIDKSVYESPGEEVEVRYFQKYLLVPDISKEED